MKRKTISPPSLFNSRIYGFSQGVLVENARKILFISGQLSADKKGNFLPGNFREQCQMALHGIEAVLKDAGATRQNVMKITAYVTDMQNNIEEFTKLTKRYFTKKHPASTLVEVRSLAFPGQLVEVEAIAVI